MNAAKPKSHSVNQNDADGKAELRHCGIIMPIAGMPPEYEAAHWARVKEVLSEAITAAGFIPRLVSESEEVGVIHGHIVQNLYDDDIVVCDVSGKNPNVMFELGMRLAFDKPTIVVKDDITAYSFDTSPIKHIPYRKDQRYDDVLNFKQAVASAIKATTKKKEEDENFSPFLKHFGTFTPKKLDNQELPQAEYIMKKLEQIEDSISDIAVTQIRRTRASRGEVGEITRWMDSIISTPKNEYAVLKNQILHELVALNVESPDFDTKEKIKSNVQSRLYPNALLMPPASFHDMFEKVWNEIAIP